MKSDVQSVFLQFLPLVEHLFNCKLLTLQTDNGTKFKPITQICSKFGIHHRFSCPYAHQQNGLVERKHRHIIEIELALLADSSLSHYLLG